MPYPQSQLPGAMPQNGDEGSERATPTPASPVDDTGSATACTEQLDGMSSALDRRRRKGLPAAQAVNPAPQASAQRVRARASDLQTVTIRGAPTPELFTPRARSSNLASSNRSPSADASTMKLAKHSPKMRPRDDVRPQSSTVFDLKEMLLSSDREAKEAEARLKSTMEWDSESEHSKPGLRRLIGSLKRRSTISGGRETTPSITQALGHAVAKHGRTNSASMGTETASGICRSDARHVGAPTQDIASTQESTEDFALRFKRKIQSKAMLLHPATSGGLSDHRTSPRTGSRLLKASPIPTSKTPSPRLPSITLATADALKRDSDPFITRAKTFKPLPPTPITASAISHQTTPEAACSTLDTYDAARAFMQQYPPPPDPDTPTRSAGRGLRSAGSDSSIGSSASRTSSTGRRLAPEVPPARPTAGIEITNPDDLPGTYVAKMAKLPRLPSPPSHPDREVAKPGFAKKLKAAEGRARDDQRTPKSGVEDRKRAERLLWKKHGDMLILRSGSHSRPPIIDYPSMTDRDLETFRSLLQREIGRGASGSAVQRLFRHVGEDKAKEDVVRHATLAKQKWVIDREIEARSDARRSDQERQPIDHVTGAQAGPFGSRQHIERVWYAGQQQATQAALEEESKPQLDGRHAPVNRQIHDKKQYERAAVERSRTYEALCKTPPHAASLGAVGLGISGMNENATSGLATCSHETRFGAQLDPSCTPSGSASNGLARDASTISLTTPLKSHSPFDEEPLRVARSSTAPISRFGRPVFQPKRNDSFMRKIEEAASNAKQLRSFGSHPALRESPPTAGLSPVPSTAPLLELSDVWDVDDEKIHGSIARAKTVGDPRKRESDRTAHGQERRDTEIGARVDTPVLILDGADGSRSFFDWDEVDVGYGTQLMKQQHFGHDTIEPTLKMTLSQLHIYDQLSLLNQFINLEYPGNPEEEEIDDIEYVDNPNYDPASHAASMRDEVDATPQASGPIINVDIDDIIAQWQDSPTAVTKEHEIRVCCARAESMLKRRSQQLKAYFATKERPLDLRDFYPTTIDEYGTFTTCSDCSRIVCPRCAVLCGEALCRQVMCGDCGKGADGRCDYHEP
ncbi:hypothetical protein LTR53_009294 [Teratosphaeriaceae sp. CCFEE 6253]|nr:hypothetical protein LTR53_009294 [Teratosphaeriaceae sp. CCFEE 6253]